MSNKLFIKQAGIIKNALEKAKEGKIDNKKKLKFKFATAKVDPLSKRDKELIRSIREKKAKKLAESYKRRDTMGKYDESDYYDNDR